MNLELKILKIGVLTLLGLLLVGVVSVLLMRQSYTKELQSLRNTVAQQDHTLELENGVFHKLTIESDDLRLQLNDSQIQTSQLKKDLAARNAKILTATELAVKWKQAYEATMTGHQTEVPGAGVTVRKQVEFQKDFDSIGVQGRTLTDPPEAWVKVTQLRPLDLSVVVTQEANGTWHTYTTSSDDNITVDIQLAGVNPRILTPRWYEGLGVRADLGVGTGLLLGAALTYHVKQFDVGPGVWLSVTDHVDHYFGGSILWHPFQNN